MSVIKRFRDDVDPYVADFEEVLRVVELSSGFVLLPIGVPGPDLAEMLARWLSVAKEHPATINIPEDAEAWKKLASWLLEVKPENNGVVVVIGSSEIAPEFSLAMRLINERRDAIAKHLDCPLLWCGPKEFLLATAEHAPDFWSVRAVERYIKAAEPRKHRIKASESKTPTSTKAELLEEAIRQGDRQSTEVIFLSQLREAMADASGDEFDLLLQSIPAGLEQADKKYRIELGLMRAEMARRSGRIAEALEILNGLDEHVEKSDDECRVELLRGRVWQKAGDTSKAELAYKQAHELGRRTNIQPITSLTDLHLSILGSKDRSKSGHTQSILRELAANEHTGDRSLKALAAAYGAEECLRHYDQRGARRWLQEAIALHEESKNDESILFPGEVDEAIRLASTAIENAADASSRAIDEKVPQKAPVTSPAKIAVTRAEHPQTDPSRRFFVLSIVALIVFVALNAYYVFSAVPRDTHCFLRVNDEIVCGKTLEQCEKLRIIAGGAGAGPCQKPHFGKLD